MKAYPVGAYFFVEPATVGEKTEEGLYLPTEQANKKLSEGIVRLLPAGVKAIVYDDERMTGRTVRDGVDKLVPGTYVQEGTKVIWSTSHGHLLTTKFDDKELIRFSMDDIDLIVVEDDGE